MRKLSRGKWHRRQIFQHQSRPQAWADLLVLTVLGDHFEGREYHVGEQYLEMNDHLQKLIIYP